MNVEIKREWTSALRSDEYPQGKGGLRSKTGYCCLGVLCDLHRKAHPEYDWKPVPQTYNPTGRFHYSGASGLLPEVVRKWAGLELDDPLVGADTLSVLNDGDSTFAEIADLIEAHL